MAEATWIIDQATGELTVEGLTAREAASLTADFLAQAEPVNRARPGQGAHNPSGAALKLLHIAKKFPSGVGASARRALGEIRTIPGLIVSSALLFYQPPSFVLLQ
jgi:hypothetical protein